MHQFIVSINNFFKSFGQHPKGSGFTQFLFFEAIKKGNLLQSLLQSKTTLQAATIKLSSYALVILLAITFSNSKLNAQITLQPQLQATGLVAKQQLWQLSIINAQATSIEAQIFLTLRDRTTGQELLTAVTGSSIFPKGAKQLNELALNPIQYNYLAPHLQSLSNNLLPIGKYTACYILQGKNDVLAEACVNFDADPLSPPMLSYPLDSANLSESPKLFTWLPPTPLAMFGAIHYTLTITEVLEGQKAANALQENLPLYIQSNLTSNSLSMPLASKSFEAGKWYAWQVLVNNGQSVAAVTDAWVFTINNPNRPSSKFNQVYFSLNNIGATYNASTDSIGIKFSNNFAAGKGYIKVFNEAQKVVYKQSIHLTNGENYFILPKPQAKASKAPFSLVLTDAQQQSYKVNLNINKP